MGKEQVVGHEGNYDVEAQRLLEEQQAKAVVVVVIDGKKGFGMSVSTFPQHAIQMHFALPQILRSVADSIDGGAGPDGVRVTEV